MLFSLNRINKQQADEMTTAHTDRRTSIATIRRRLEKLELEHLRAHAAELANLIEGLQSDLASAEFQVDMWHADCLRLVQDALPENTAIGLAIDGSLHLVPASTGANAA